MLGYFANPKAGKTIVLSHGNAGDIADRAILIGELLDAGASVFAFDYAGYGKSTGKPSIEELMIDGDAAYDYLTNGLKVPSESIIIMGESIGTGVACHVAAHHPCHSVILQAPFYALARLAKLKFFWLRLYPDFVNPFADIDNAKAIANVSVPILILYGANDFTIPPSEPKDLAKVCKPGTCALVEIPGRDHNGLYHPPCEKYRKEHVAVCSERLNRGSVA